MYTTRQTALAANVRRRSRAEAPLRMRILRAQATLASVVGAAAGDLANNCSGRLSLEIMRTPGVVEDISFLLQQRVVGKKR